MLHTKRDPQIEDSKLPSGSEAENHRDNFAKGLLRLALSNSPIGNLISGLSKLNRSEERSGCGCLIPIVLGATGIWSLITGRPEDASSSREHFPLPERLIVRNTTLPFQTTTVSDPNDPSLKTEVKFIEPSTIDFSKDFVLETDRYKIVKHDDWVGTRWIGHIASIPTKLFFWDYRAGLGVDADGTKNIIGMLERDKSVKGLMVRINHNQVFEDVGRAVGDDRAVERNPGLARWLYGAPGTFLGEAFSELRRGDYYNPMTGTAVIYSNVPAIYAHEAGHHKDFDRFTSDWLYSMVGKVPGVILYPEAQASIRAKDELLPDDLKWQFDRYLIPAFGTYVLYSLAALIRLKKKSEED